jgi:hypothetical protein
MRSIDSDRGREDLGELWLDRRRLRSLENDIQFWQDMFKRAEKRVEWYSEDLERERELANKVYFPIWWQVITTIVSGIVIFLGSPDRHSGSPRLAMGERDGGVTQRRAVLYVRPVAPSGAAEGAVSDRGIVP